PRVERVALQLTERLRPLDEPSVWIDNGITRILPAHVFVTLLRSSLILLEPVAIQIAKSVDPLKATQRRVAELTQQIAIAEPFPRLVEHDQVQGGCVRRPVVGGMGNLVQVGQFAGPDFMQDLARFSIAPIVALGGLECRQLLERAARETWKH